MSTQNEIPICPNPNCNSTNVKQHMRHPRGILIGAIPEKYLKQ